MDALPLSALRYRKVCQDHFEDSQFKNSDTKKTLVSNAVPTLCNVPNPPAKLALKRKLPQRVELEQPAEKSPRLIEATTPSVNDGASTSTYSTPLCMDTSTPTAAKYKRMEQKMWKLQKRLQRMRKTMKLLPNVSRLKLARSEKSKHAAKVDVAMNIIKDMVPPTTLQFIHSQLVLSVAKTKGKRFTRKDKIVALGVYYYSQKAYKYLATILRLPSIRTYSVCWKTSRWLQDFMNRFSPR